MSEIEFAGQSIIAKNIKFVGAKLEDASPQQTIKILNGLNMFWSIVASVTICIFIGFSFVNFIFSFAIIFVVLSLVFTFLFDKKEKKSFSRAIPYLVYMDGINIKVIEGQPALDPSVINEVNAQMMIEGVYGEQIQTTNDTVGFTYDKSKSWVR